MLLLDPIQSVCYSGWIEIILCGILSAEAHLFPVFLLEKNVPHRHRTNNDYTDMQYHILFLTHNPAS